MYIAILGRQPALGIAELERCYSDVTWFSDQSAIIRADALDLRRLGGTQKAGRIVAELSGDWRRVSQKIVQTYTQNWSGHDSKITLGISAYGFDASPRDIQKTGIILKGKLKSSGVSLRLVPNDTAALSTATSHHNKLGLSGTKVELIIVRNKTGKVVIAESIGAQNITAYARRDQGRPKRDAFVGMLPPKLAQIMINLASPVTVTPNAVDGSSTPSLAEDVPVRASQAPQAAPRAPVERPLQENGVDEPERTKTLLDPFCGTGVILQEAALQGYTVYGTDLSEKMVDYSQQNLAWLEQSHHANISSHVEQGDAQKHTWQQPVDIIAAETYLGQPFSAPPSPSKLAEVRGNCTHIITEFLRNIGAQIKPGTPLCVAVPAWRHIDGSFTHLPLIDQLGTLGYTQVPFKTVHTDELLYYRDDQVVARELLVLVKS